jgi:predicted tellurium resistance membrane protein TerC
MEMKWAFIIGIAILLFTMYYLEREMEKKQIFWLYAGLGVVLSIVSVRTVVQHAHNFDTYLTFAVLFILIAILYFDEGTEVAPPQKDKEIKKKKPKKKKSKGR